MPLLGCRSLMPLTSRLYLRPEVSGTRLGDRKARIVRFAFVPWADSCHKRQNPQAPTPQAPIRNRQTRKVANAKGLNRNTNLA